MKLLLLLRINYRRHIPCYVLFRAPLIFREFHNQTTKSENKNIFHLPLGSNANNPWIKAAQKSSITRSYDDYKTDIEKLDESAKKAYNEGFIKAFFFKEYEQKGGQQSSGNTDGNPTIFAFKRIFAKTVEIILITGLTFTVFTGFIYLSLRFAMGRGMSLDSIQHGIFPMVDQEVNVTFEDVCGIDEAKLEVQEIVEYLRDPQRYTRLGARLPKGVLLVGPPGTGKTLLARAIAGEASVPFFHASGSEFDEVFVGQGAKRVRELFSKAKKNAPCVIFIDEIDTVGSKRTSSSMHPYANQTINQLLSEMDGFVQNEGIIVIGATNRKDNLDTALLRAGRFDVQVNVPLPDLAGRKEIFNLYLNKIICGDIDSMKLAKGTIGFSGADIENMVNQAALKAASDSAQKVAMRHLDEARDRILMGPARLKGRYPDEEANRNTAFHEAGHAIVALFTKNANPIHKVTIIPRGGSLGHTSQMPEKDHLQMTKSQLLAELDVAMGGRVAEELIFGAENITTGASSDLKKATAIAERMVKIFGMSDKVGLRDFSTQEQEELGAFGRGPHTNDKIDDEIKQLMQDSYDRAKEILVKHSNEHQLLAEALLEYETLTKIEVDRIIRGEKLTRASPMQLIKTTSGNRGVRRNQPRVDFFPDRNAE